VSSIGRARDALQQYFGFTDFREGQEEVIDSVLEGHDSVAVMPTGGGKSLCYQLPALMLDGVTLVVSPLIALMKDQVDALATRGIPTTFINSSLSYGETNRRLSEMRRGLYKLVYVAPERFRSAAFENSISELHVKLLAVDEAHCISHWGHDFRPDYLRLKQAAELMRRPQIIALTATATPQVRADISTQLGLTSPRIFVAGFARPNLALRVLHTSSDKEKLGVLKQIVARAGGSGIVYTATRKSVEQITAKLKMSGLRAEAYHGGMDEGQRTRVQDAFMGGHAQAIVATNAFGMGIDKSDIRFVVHYHLPGSIEAYYQEVGRAGRDGAESECVLMFNYADTRTHQFFIEGNHPSPEVIGQVYDQICDAGRETVQLSAREIASMAGIKNDMSVSSALGILEKAKHIERGRPSGSTLEAWMKLPADKALAAAPEESVEDRLVRELIFSWDLNDRDHTEIDLRRIATQVEAPEARVRRALAALAARGILAYRTSYEGRGIRLLDEKPARPLRIDTKELAARAAAEQSKLRRMIDYCYWEKGCLQRFILNYFGDRKQIENCGICSNCFSNGHDAEISLSGIGEPAGTLSLGRQGHPLPQPTRQPTRHSTRPPTDLDRFIIDEAPSGRDLREELRGRALQARALDQVEREIESSRAKSLSEDDVIVVKKVLSCVARLKGKYGKGAVTAVLRGSSSKQVLDNNLHKLSTYGLLRYMSQEDTTAYVKALIQAGCISVQQGAYPTVTLTDFGREVMLGRSEVLLELPS
jgi:ATP-dependent DNA helicase RecQ